ncbi:MAG: MarR family transcriptional regulator [Gordonia sp. (in: high G+C Gram-positive bacteria)]
MPASPRLSTDIAVVYQNMVTVTRALRSRAPGNLSAGLASALWTVICHGPLRLSELAEREKVTMPTMSRIVASLETQGYLERSPDPDDGRARQLVATEAGADLIGHARSEKAQLLAAAMDRLDPETREHLVTGLTDLVTALGELEP